MPAPTDSSPKFDAYAHPERLVSTDWLAEHLSDPDVVLPREAWSATQWASPISIRSNTACCSNAS